MLHTVRALNLNDNLVVTEKLNLSKFSPGDSCGQHSADGGRPVIISSSFPLLPSVVTQ